VSEREETTAYKLLRNFPNKVILALRAYHFFLYKSRMFSFKKNLTLLKEGLRKNFKRFEAKKYFWVFTNFLQLLFTK